MIPRFVLRDRIMCAILAPFRNEIRDMVDDVLIFRNKQQREKQEYLQRESLKLGDTVQVHDGHTIHCRALVEYVGGRLVVVIPDVTPADPSPPEDGAGPTDYLLTCYPCGTVQRFGDNAARQAWADEHDREFGHSEVDVRYDNRPVRR